MNILVVGQGGREHAIIKTLKKSPKVKKIFCAPGNGGIEQDAICLPIQEKDLSELAHAVKELSIDLTVVGPEGPLLDGIVDYFHERSLAIIGPTKAAANIEGSKAFAKNLMKKYSVPTGDYQVFDRLEDALGYVREKGVPTVIKADGLAAGKGVTVAFELEEAERAIQEIMGDKIFGEAGNRVVIEEYLEGEELTVMAFVDGETIIPMEFAQDHKPVFDGDKGPNTGGMGSYSPVPHLAKTLNSEVYDKVLVPIVNGMKLEGIPFTGILYAGIMVTKKGPMVIEFNARFGDPETQVVLPRLKTDLLEVFMAMINQRLDKIELEWTEESAVCVIMASGGYPREYSVGHVISIESRQEEVEIYVAGAQKLNNQLITSGGRVLGVTALAESIENARVKAYEGVHKIDFEGAHFRKDIGIKAMKAIINLSKKRL